MTCCGSPTASSPDRIAVKTDVDKRARALQPHGCIIPALHDAEQGSLLPGVREGALAAFGPGERQPHGAFKLRARRRQLDAFIELHGDVGPEQLLNFDRALGRQLDRGAVEMGAKGDAGVLHLAQLCKGHDLKPAEIGEDGMRPIHELVQATERRNAFRAGPQHEVVGVAEHDVGTARTQSLRRHALHRRLRADRHERGRRHHAVGGGDLAASRSTIASEEAKGESFAHSLKSKQASP